MYNWSEDLPEGCPDSEGAEPVTEPTVFYRGVYNNPPKDEDFDSARLTYAKDHPFSKNLTECRIRSVSLFSNLAKAESFVDRMKKRGKAGHRPISDAWVGEIELDSTAGVVKFDKSGHVSWWRCKNFNAPSKITVLELS